MALVAHFDMELHQTDVKTVFFNGDLKEEVYKKQPEGSFQRGMITWFVGLKNLFMG